LKEKPQIRQDVQLRNMRTITKAFTDLTIHELYAILQLRMEVFVVEQTCYYQDCDGRDQESLHHWFEHTNGEIMAYVRICAPGVSYAEPSIGRVIVAENYRRKSLGKQIMESSIAIATKHFSAGSIRISAQKYLEDFYTNLGFVPTGKEYLEDGIPHLEMLLNK